MRIHTLLMASGVVILVASFAFWFATGRESLIMALGAISLVATGAFQSAGKPGGD